MGTLRLVDDQESRILESQLLSTFHARHLTRPILPKARTQLGLGMDLHCEHFIFLSARTGNRLADRWLRNRRRSIWAEPRGVGCVCSDRTHVAPHVER